MELINLRILDVNQNGYHFNKLTQNKIGMLYISSVNYTPEDCLACDGYVVKIIDYKPLYLVIGKTFNTGEEADDEFRIPDYNITNRFLQPSNKVAIKINAGLPNITGTFGIGDTSGTYTSGAFYTISGTRWNEGGGSKGSNPDVGFNASRSSSIYGQSPTVQPPSQTVKLCIKYK